MCLDLLTLVSWHIVFCLICTEPVLKTTVFMYKIILSWHTIKIKQYNILFLTKICCQYIREYNQKGPASFLIWGESSLVFLWLVCMPCVGRASTWKMALFCFAGLRCVDALKGATFISTGILQNVRYGARFASVNALKGATFISADKL